MIALWIILCIFILLLLWVILTPVKITIDTEEEIYHFKMSGIIEGNLVHVDDKVLIKMKIFKLIRYNIRPSLPKRKKKEQEKRSKKKFRWKKVPFKAAYRLMKDILMAFRIRKLELEFDLDDEALNAQLYPFCMYLSNERLLFRVNWDSYYRLFLMMQFRLGSFISAGFKYIWASRIKPKINLKTINN